MPHRLRVLVSDADIDELGHASNLCYVRWVLDAARSHSSAVGLGPSEYVARGQAFVVRRHELTYRRPAFAGDVLTVETRVVALRGASSVRETVIYRGEPETPGDLGETLLQARTGWAFIALESGRPTRIPEDIRARFAIDPPILPVA